MAGDTVTRNRIAGVVLRSLRNRPTAISLGVTGQAAAAVIIRSSRLFGRHMWIMTRSAEELASGIATTRVHLLDLSHGGLSLRYIGFLDKNRPKKLPGHTGAEVEGLSPWMKDAHGALKVALFANRSAEGWLQEGGVHDRVVRTAARFTPLTPGDMKLTGTVTALAADGVPLEYRRAISIDGAIHRLGMVRVAKQAIGRNRPIGMRIGLKPRRKVPNPLLRVPGNGRLEQVSLAIDQIGASSGAGTKRISDFGDKFSAGGAVRIESNPLMK